MDRESIAVLASKLKTKEDILSLLNRIKRSDMADGGVADEHPFTMKHINFYCNPNHTFHRYHQFTIKKKSGGERTITAPRNKTFRLMLRYINEIFKSMYTPSSYAMGFTEGRSVVTNAQKHIGHNYIFNTDLKDFFPSIDKSRVWKRLQLAPFNFPSDVAHVFAGLCSMKGKRIKGDVEEVAMFLPQGAPTSPIITNMICDRLDHRLAGLAKRFGLTYTRYADDTTFSSPHYVYAKDGEFMTELKRIIEGQNLTINDKKTRLQKRGGRQEVTGIVVSDKINVTQKYISDIRFLLFIWEKFGLAAANSKFLPKYKVEKGHVKKGNPNIVNVLDGKLLYLKMVRGEEDSVYTRLRGQFDKLVSQLNSSVRTSSTGILYVNSMNLVDFEKATGKEVKLHFESSGKKWAQFYLGDTNKVASIRKEVTPDFTKDQLSISICRDGNNSEFWLIHKSFQPKEEENVTIDDLNNELDELLNM